MERNGKICKGMEVVARRRDSPLRKQWCLLSEIVTRQS